MLRFPFGVSYSCYWGFSTVITNPADDTLSEEDKALEELIIISNDIITNLFFNLGYIYADIFALYELEPANANYWRNLGIYSGDITIRFFWRKRFTRNFEYDQVE